MSGRAAGAPRPYLVCLSPNFFFQSESILGHSECSGPEAGTRRACDSHVRVQSGSPCAVQHPRKIHDGAINGRRAARRRRCAAAPRRGLLGWRGRRRARPSLSSRPTRSQRTREHGASHGEYPVQCDGQDRPVRGPSPPLPTPAPAPPPQTSRAAPARAARLTRRSVARARRPESG